jgi:hypothetical protein
MIDEHALHPDVTPAVAGSLQHLQDDQQNSGPQPAQEKKMRRAFAIAVAVAVVLASLGAVMASKHATEQRVTMAGTATANVPGAAVGVDARRTDLLRRIDEARNAGHLKGVGYMALLGEHQSIQVAQRRAEAQGMTDTAVRDLNAAIDHANAKLDRHLRSH